MARVTVEDCLKRVPNRFFLVHIATKRVRQLNEGAPRLIEHSENEDVVTALREIAAGKVFIKEEETSPPEKANAPEKPEKPVKLEAPEQTDQADQAEQAEQPEDADQAEPPDTEEPGE